MEEGDSLKSRLYSIDASEEVASVGSVVRLRFIHLFDGISAIILEDHHFKGEILTTNYLTKN
jgi:hypothetical protein